MKGLPNFLAILCLSVAFVGPATASPPDWFGRQIPVGANEIIGYGEGDTLDEAIAKARDQIATSIQVHVSSDFSAETRAVNEKVTKKVEAKTRQRTDLDLGAIEKIDHYDDVRKDKKYYVVRKYENLPIENKFAKRINVTDCHDDQQNRYLKETPLVQAINREAKCTPALEIKRVDKLWKLAYGDVILPLVGDFGDRMLVHISASKIITLSASHDMLVEGKAFSLSAIAQRDGYVTVFDVYENGEVFLIATNQPIKARKALTIPDPSAENELVAGLLTPGVPAKDLYVAIFSTDKAVYSRFQRCGTQLEKGEDHFKFHELVKILDQNEFSTVLVRTQPK